ncbi:MAG: SDR family oxidoreductase, partial [Proteocatella sp.]
MVIITGASKGIGKYLFEYYLKKGFDVIGIYNSTKPNKNLDNYISLNICDEEAVAKFVSSYELNDITLINAAGITLAAIAHKMDILNFEKTLNVNVVGSFNMIKYLLPLM